MHMEEKKRRKPKKQKKNETADTRRTEKKNKNETAAWKRNLRKNKATHTKAQDKADENWAGERSKVHRRSSAVFRETHHRCPWASWHPRRQPQGGLHVSPLPANRLRHCNSLT